jgi:hypothetical protein
MYPLSSYELAKAVTADLHNQARRDALARAARQARRAHPPARASRTPVRRLVTALCARTSA